MTMNENTNTVSAVDNTAAETGKTFSQEDVNRIIQERLAKEKTKVDAAAAQREQELTKRELMLTAKEQLTSKGLPAELADALNASDKDALEKSLDILDTYIKNRPSPGIPGAPNPPMPGNTGSVRAAFGLK